MSLLALAKDFKMPKLGELKLPFGTGTAPSSTSQGARAALHVSPDGVAFAIVADGQLRVGRERIAPKVESSSNDLSEALAETIQALVVREKLAGCDLAVVLSGDMCVTRVVAGPSDIVENEIHEIEQRSSLYLSLGAGPKTLVHSTRTIDAKRSHGCVTIANEQLLETLCQMLAEAGVKPRRIEHSLVAASRLLGRLQSDTNDPLMILEKNARGVDVGISFQGHLLLDYRPGSTGAGNIGETIALHLDRIQRHCSRNFSFATGRIRKVLVCGETIDVDEIGGQFERSHGPAVDQFDLAKACEPWLPPADAGDGRWLIPLLGALGDGSIDGPDLMSPIRMRQRSPIGPLVVKTFWPIAAAAVVTLLIAAAGWRQASVAASLEKTAQEAQEGEGELKSIQTQLASATRKTKSYAVIDESVSGPQWHQLMVELASVVPEGVWLEGVKVDQTGALFLSGTSFAEDSVYKFVEELKAVDMIANVSLEGTRTTRLQNNQATVFDIRGSFVGRKESTEESESHD